jgi:hypothetical protein
LLFQGSHAGALRFASALARALGEWQSRVPLGNSSDEERAEVARYAATLAYSGELIPAGSGSIGVAPAESALALAPSGRNLHVIPLADAPTRAALLSAHVTTVASACEAALASAIRAALPHARPAAFGRMQCPPFDGPVDLRAPSLRSHEIFRTPTAR